MSLLGTIEKNFLRVPLSYWGHRLLDLPLLLKWGKIPRGATVLEIGCGAGKISQHLLKTLKCKNYTGVDISPQKIAQAEAGIHRSTRIIFQVADALKLPFTDNSFDAVIEMDLLHHLPNWKKALHEMQRVLKENGTLLLGGYSLETFTMPGVGHLLQSFMEHPYREMYNQVELLSFIRKNGFVITHQNDRSWMMLLAAVKKTEDHGSSNALI